LSHALKKDATKIEPKLNDTQCGFFHGSTTKDQISLYSKFEKSWEYAKDICTCFANLEKA